MEKKNSLCTTCSRCEVLEQNYNNGYCSMICSYYNKVSGHPQGHEAHLHNIISCKGYKKKKEKKLK